MKKLGLFLMALMLNFNANAEPREGSLVALWPKVKEIAKEAINVAYEEYKAKKTEFETKVRVEAKANGEELSDEEVNAKVEAMLTEFYKVEKGCEIESADKKDMDIGSSAAE